MKRVLNERNALKYPLAGTHSNRASCFMCSCNRNFVRFIPTFFFIAISIPLPEPLPRTIIEAYKSQHILLFWVILIVLKSNSIRSDSINSIILRTQYSKVSNISQRQKLIVHILQLIATYLFGQFHISEVLTF